MRTLSLSDVPKSEQLALFVGNTGENQRHVGLAYRPEPGAPLRYLHLAGHLDLCDEDELTGVPYRAALVNAVPQPFHSTVVAHCRRSASADLDPQHVEYGLGYLRATISRDGADRLVVEGNSSGFTCATFVLAIFALADLRLLATDSWVDRDGDAEWKATVVERLSRRLPLDGDRATKLRADRDLARIRPEDVAGGATCSAAPVGYAEATIAGVEVLGELTGAT